jgi:hypothetical protein
MYTAKIRKAPLLPTEDGRRVRVLWPVLERGPSPVLFQAPNIQRKTFIQLRAARVSPQPGRTCHI